MEKDVELRGWKAHCVYLQDKCERLELENSRLQAAIDAANAQEPEYFAREGGVAVSAATLEVATDGQKELYCIPLYARPIPAQQSVEQAHMAGQADAGVDPSYSNAHAYAILAQQSKFAGSDKVLFNGSHGHAGYVIDDQQSQAVADCDHLDPWQIWIRNK